jgi:hypothetical protein
VEAYERTTFTPTLQWYRTSRLNWEDEAGLPMVVTQPALLVLAGRDRVLRPAMADGMEAHVPNLTRAVRAWRRVGACADVLTDGPHTHAYTYTYFVVPAYSCCQMWATGSATRRQSSSTPCWCGGCAHCVPVAFRRLVHSLPT